MTNSSARAMTLAIASTAAFVAVLCGSSHDALASAPVRFGPRDIRSVAYVAKSENKNEVHYALALDERCMPAGASPVYGYWQMHERGPSVVEPILDREQRAYGIAKQLVDGNTVTVHLHALPGRRIIFETRRVGDTCTARALAPIDGKMAQLASVYVKLGLLFHVNYLLVQGVSLEDGKALKERVEM
jgi:hypothetical protein